MCTKLSRMLLLGTFTVGLATVGWGEEILARPLLRQAAIPARQGVLTEYLVEILKSAHISGGVVLTSEKCTEEPVERFPEVKGSVEDALKRLVATGHSISWLEANGSVVISNAKQVPPILKISLRQFEFSRSAPLTKSSSDLLGLKEVNKEAQALRLVEYGPELGFAQAPKPPTQQDIVVLTDTTVLAALNAVGQNRGIWLYKQLNCGRNQMSLNWPVR